jgi:hypothetical protein
MVGFRPATCTRTLLQLGLERGVPALLCWLLLLFVYASMLWRLARSKEIDDWIERGIVLGALGGLCGFFASGLVHYNWGRFRSGDDLLFHHGPYAKSQVSVSGLKS